MSAGLRHLLDRFYREYDFRERILHDPIEFPHCYKDPRDIEIAGFIASCLAYGRVVLFKPVIGKLLSAMGSSPYAFMTDFDLKRDRKFVTFKYRFNEAADIVCLLYIIHQLLIKHGSLENTFKRHYKATDADTKNCIAGFAGEINSIHTAEVYGENMHPSGLTQFFPSPEKGSACKRMNLFLRWMVRDTDIDFGIWKCLPKNKLVIPLDTHIARISRCLGLTSRKTSDWKTAVEITESLKKLDPSDPLKYDFALCHYGISRECDPNDMEGCEKCILTQDLALIEKISPSALN